MAAGILAAITLMIVARCGREPSAIRTAERMVASGELIGQTVDEVADKLGLEWHPYHLGGWDADICLGPSQGLMPIDNTWLVMKVDDAGRILEAKVVED